MVGEAWNLEPQGTGKHWLVILLLRLRTDLWTLAAEVTREENWSFGQSKVFSLSTLPLTGHAWWTTGKWKSWNWGSPAWSNRQLMLDPVSQYPVEMPASCCQMLPLGSWYYCWDEKSLVLHYIGNKLVQAHFEACRQNIFPSVLARCGLWATRLQFLLEISLGAWETVQLLMLLLSLWKNHGSQHPHQVAHNCL